MMFKNEMYTRRSHIPRLLAVNGAYELHSTEESTKDVVLDVTLHKEILKVKLFCRTIIFSVCFSVT